MRISAGVRQLSRLAVITAIGGLAAGCSSDSMRLAGNPFSNPFAAKGDAGEPRMTGSIASAPRTAVQSQPLPAPRQAAAPAYSPPALPKPLPSPAPSQAVTSGPGGWTAQAASLQPLAGQPKGRLEAPQLGQAQAARQPLRPGQPVANLQPPKAQPAPEPQKTARAEVQPIPQPKVATPVKPEPAPAAKEPEQTASLPSGASEFRWPARGRVISGFGSAGNEGINIAVPEGTPVKAAESGTVAYAGSEVKGYGNLVLIRHDNGFVSAYAHNGEITVKRGDKVKRGQVVAKSGQSGNVTSPQLHFEIRKGSTPVDPMPFLDN
jgi:biotin carboxyl carrier protein